MLGRLAEADAKRDAIHMAIAPVVAGERLSPGDEIGFIGEAVGRTQKSIGIVDPFLAGPVFKGERFFMLLHPGTITSLRHEWEHPAFAVSADKQPVAATEDSEAYLRRIAGAGHLSYEDLLDRIQAYLDDKYFGVTGKSGSFSDYYEDAIWDHYESVTGVRVPADKRENCFSCSC
jgi:hypothetical protein